MLQDAGPTHRGGGGGARGAIPPPPPPTILQTNIFQNTQQNITLTEGEGDNTNIIVSE